MRPPAPPAVGDQPQPKRVRPCGEAPAVLVGLREEGRGRGGGPPHSAYGSAEAPTPVFLGHPTPPRPLPMAADTETDKCGSLHTARCFLAHFTCHAREAHSGTRAPPSPLAGQPPPKRGAHQTEAPLPAQRSLMQARGHRKPRWTILMGHFSIPPAGTLEAPSPMGERWRAGHLFGPVPL